MARAKTKRKRLGHLETKLVDTLLGAVKDFAVTAIDAKARETALNKRLISHLTLTDSEVKSTQTDIVHFAGEKFVPDGVFKGRAAYPLLAIECKRLTPSLKAAKKCWKEGLAQATLYARRYKVVFLVLYDFTTGAIYKQAFGRGNKVESSFAAALRELRIHVVVLAP